MTISPSRQNIKNTIDPLINWIDSTLQPNAFVTILMPVTNTPRPHEFYLSLWTRQAEASLWGKSALHITNHADRCLWLLVRETNRQDWTRRLFDGRPRKLHHYHALLRMPRFSFAFKGHKRPMLTEHRARRMLTTAERCFRMQEALIAASKRTPEPYALSRLDSMRGADIDVRPYRREHTRYIFKESKPRYFEHWSDQRPDDKLLRDHGMFILPHLPQHKETH